MRVCVCFRIGDYAGVRSISLTVGPVLRNAADAVQLSNMMRLLPQSASERKVLASGTRVLEPEYPQIAPDTLDGIF